MNLREEEYLTSIPKTNVKSKKRLNLLALSVSLISDPAYHLRFLSSSVLWLRPEMRLVVVGHLDAMHSVTSHRALRNTDHVVFMAPRGRNHRNVKEGDVNFASKGQTMKYMLLNAGNKEYNVQDF